MSDSTEANMRLTEKKHHSWKDHFTSQDPHKAREHRDENDSKGKTSASAMKTEDAPQTEPAEPKKETKWHKFQSHVAKGNEKHNNDDIWGHYRGPGH